MAETAWNMPAGELMKGKKGLIMGVANANSIAWGIASQLAAQGAELAFTYLGEGLERRVRPLAESVGAKLLIPADVTDDASMASTRMSEFSHRTRPLEDLDSKGVFEMESPSLGDSGVSSSGACRHRGCSDIQVTQIRVLGAVHVWRLATALCRFSYVCQ
jgi:hypothetical protein